MAAALPFIIGGTMVAGTILKTSAQLKAGKDANKLAQFKAKQLETGGKADIAAAHRAAQEKRRKAALMSSRVLALAAASGGGTLDPNVVNAISGFEEEGDLAARTELYQGKESARQKRMGASGARYEGYSELVTSRVRATNTLLSGTGSLLSKYGS